MTINLCDAEENLFCYTTLYNENKSHSGKKKNNPELF